MPLLTEHIHCQFRGWRGRKAFGNAWSEFAVGEKAHCYTYEVGVCLVEVTLGNGSVESVLIEAVIPGVP